MTVKWEMEVEKRLLEYMNHPSTTGNEAEFAKIVALDLEENGWTVHEQMIPNTNRFNVYATFRNSDPKNVKVLLNTHLDTVPPYFPPTQDEKNIYGNGSNDAKGQLAAMVTAATIIAKTNEDVAKTVGLLFVVGEELDHIGMIEANKLEILPEYLLVGEPTELKFGTIQKGALKVKLTVAGRAGHSGYPDSGLSAIHTMIEVLNDVQNFKWPCDETHGNTTYNIGKIAGGQALNAWAAFCEADIFFRVVTSVKNIQELLTDVVKGRAEISLLSYNDPVILDAPPINAQLDQVSFNTDIAYFDAKDKVKGKYLFGGGSIKNAHSKNEFIPKNELHQCTATLVKLINHLYSA
uniref:M20_dimer domain-containing protein n=1 Tax=Caenorhabditis japonica TaxID=281687 RepID=A0A8R1DYM9_CAEJA